MPPTLTETNHAVRALGHAIHQLARAAPGNEDARELADAWNEWMLDAQAWRLYGLPYAYGALVGFWERYDSVRADVLRTGPPSTELPESIDVEPTPRRLWESFSAAQVDDVHAYLDAAWEAVGDGVAHAWRTAGQVRDIVVEAATPEFVGDVRRGARLGWGFVGVGLVLWLFSRLKN